MPNDTTTAVQHPPKAHLRLPSTSWLRPSSFDKHSCPYVGQWSSPTHPGQVHRDLSSTTFTDREQRLFNSRIITNAPSSKPGTTRHTYNCACNLPKPRPQQECIFQHNSHPCKTEASTPDMPTHSLGHEPPAAAASGAISALRRNSKSEKQVENQNSDKTENQ